MSPCFRDNNFPFFETPKILTIWPLWFVSMLQTVIGTGLVLSFKCVCVCASQCFLGTQVYKRAIPQKRLENGARFSSYLAPAFAFAFPFGRAFLCMAWPAALSAMDNACAQGTPEPHASAADSYTRSLWAREWAISLCFSPFFFFRSGPFNLR